MKNITAKCNHIILKHKVSLLKQYYNATENNINGSSVCNARSTSVIRLLETNVAKGRTSREGRGGGGENFVFDQQG